MRNATSSVAEFVSAKEGLKIALNNNWVHLVIEGDAKNVIDHLKMKAVIKAKEDSKQAKEIDLIASKFTNLHKSHVFRRCNRVADKFAKLGYSLKDRKIWHYPPQEVRHLLEQDKKHAS
ncbi:uncharacterized protein LOC120271574 [Dioscorea cayenensis subsp. rotundata]|uniref:Uncharacterized protein LOC120271574 n=1 Tax=Dioscorea cayennensis subsp. rotundata TaxID=55577 RepID=A0AB40C5N9_DIOCR|nr:uncharacterized protein LOC120271574 [Dioscorea cayenensis subsp. rotundata]